MDNTTATTTDTDNDYVCPACGRRQINSDGWHEAECTGPDNPTMSFPTMMAGHETRTVASTSGGLHQHGTWNGRIDWSRATQLDTGWDALIYPAWSDGTEHRVYLAYGDTVTAEPKPDDAETGLRLTITRAADNSEQRYEVHGWLRAIALDR